ncbi:hypothetical protein FPZ12_006895 [Amycolatopsis acidicola]|uniref:Uncharacterized protein n=1 Tax=Amycolatopsis acidicola TaxID=2596893 RepID=A0A5N0VJV5_9PSEU|nr:hypothetical protein [Amycolatopsis acidicola]KAA9164971.1 hypothetical protein FPZ12_006895 [Amycolatopsis acidicola]
MSEESSDQELKELAIALGALPLSAATAAISLYREQYRDIAESRADAVQLNRIADIFDEIEGCLQQIRSNAAGFGAQLEEILEGRNKSAEGAL